MIVPFEGYLKSNGLVSFIIPFYYTGTLKTEPYCYLKLAVKCPSSLREDSGVGAQSNRWQEGYGRGEERAVGGNSRRVGSGRNKGKLCNNA